jgi:hypothetical protein
MKTTKYAFAVLAMVGGLMVATAPSRADDFAFSFNTGDVAFAYTDGYWDNNHVWHRWHNQREMREYRTRYHDHWHAWRHNRDRDHGWHDDRDWDNHHHR